MTSCSLKSCKAGVTSETGRVEVRAYKVTESERKSLKANWDETGDAVFHHECWQYLVSASKTSSPDKSLSELEVKLVKEAKKTAEYHDSDSSITKEADRIVKMLKKATYPIFFTGAGISTAAGIGDFRGKDGKWTERDKAKEHGAKGGKVKTGRKGIMELRPTYTHEAIVKLLEMGKFKYVISQNTDGLHRLSGVPPEKISELHGNAFIQKCEKCEKRFDVKRSHRAMTMGEVMKVPPKKCERCHISHRTGSVCEEKSCGGYLMNTIINFGDYLESQVLGSAEENAKKADIVFCLGSTLMVTPASTLVEMGRKPIRLVICNRQGTPYDDYCSHPDENVQSKNLSEISESARDFVGDHKIAIACTVTAACGLLAFKRYMAGGVCRSKALMKGKTVLITGANTGIGKETAKDLARRGARVLLACRDITKAERAAEDIRKSTGNQDVVVYILDLCSLQSVRQCADNVLQKEARLDVLINNAGVMWTPYWKTKDGFEMQFGTNHLGHFLFTNLLLDLLKKSAPSRIINVSSLAHERGTINFDDINSEKSYSPAKAYSQSKLANVLFTRELSKRLQGTKVMAYSLHPGAVDTELVRFKDLQILPLRIIANIVYYGLVKHFIKTAEQGAQTTIYCAVSPDLENASGKYFSDCAVKTEAPQAQDDEAAAKLWTVSEEMVGLTRKS